MIWTLFFQNSVSIIHKFILYFPPPHLMMTKRYVDISSDCRHLNSKLFFFILYLVFFILYFVSCILDFHPHHQIRKRWTYHRTAGILIGIWYKWNASVSLASHLMQWPTLPQSSSSSSQSWWWWWGWWRWWWWYLEGEAGKLPGEVARILMWHTGSQLDWHMTKLKTFVQSSSSSLLAY